MVDRAVVTIRGAARVVAAFILAASVACAGNAGSDDGGQTSDVPERDVSFETSDGVNLTGRLFGEGRVGVTLAHMYPSDATSWYGAARTIARSGYMALAFNFRGYAGSEGEKSPSRTTVDLEAAVEELQRRGARDLVFVGASMGGTASIIAGATNDPLAIVAISAPTNFMGLDAPVAATDVQRPVLLMASRGDDAAFSSVQSLERALPNPDTKVYDGDAHGTSLLNDRPEAVDEIVAFLKRYAPTTDAIPTPGSDR